MNGDFRVSQSGRADETFIEILTVLKSRGQGVSAARSARWIIEELSRTPMEFGESRETFESLNIHTRIGYSGPFQVQFAVHVSQHHVFINRWSLRKEHGG